MVMVLVKFELSTSWVCAVTVGSWLTERAGSPAPAIDAADSIGLLEGILGLLLAQVAQSCAGSFWFSDCSEP